MLNNNVFRYRMLHMASNKKQEAHRPHHWSPEKRAVPRNKQLSMRKTESILLSFWLNKKKDFLEKGSDPSVLQKIHSPLPKNALYHVWLK